MKHSYSITGMTCTSCVAHVKNELLKSGDIESAEVQLQHPQATVTMSRHITLPQLQQIVSKAGPYTITEDDSTSGNEGSDKEGDAPSYYPIALIFSYIAGLSAVVTMTSGHWHWMGWMQYVMAGFFLVFSFFKLMNLRGFAEGYSTYDLVARRFRTYGYIYPFIELALGLAFLTGIFPLVTNIIAFLVMSISAIGVIQGLARKSRFQCACLGTIIKLPLSKVTLFEDLAMVLMSGLTILFMA